MKEFEVTEEEIENQKKLHEEIRKRWEALGISEEMTNGIKDNIKEMYEGVARNSEGITFPFITKPMARTFELPLEPITDEE